VPIHDNKLTPSPTRHADRRHANLGADDRVVIGVETEVGNGFLGGLLAQANFLFGMRHGQHNDLRTYDMMECRHGRHATGKVAIILVKEEDASKGSRDIWADQDCGAGNFQREVQKVLLLRGRKGISED
jgi:hypothetical protein